MMKSKIKICGITTLPDAQLALDLGADLLGFNFYPPSPRCIDPKTAANIIAQLSKPTLTVAVTVNPSLDELKQLLDQCPLDMIQLHGDETDTFCRQARELGPQVIKALRIRRPDDIASLANYTADAFLLDAFREDLYGGTGHTFDWSWLTAASHDNIFLAGGITPANITQALAVGAYGVDLCSGVEKSPGQKDPKKMKLLFQRINAYYDSQS